MLSLISFHGKGRSCTTINSKPILPGIFSLNTSGHSHFTLFHAQLFQLLYCFFFLHLSCWCSGLYRGGKSTLPLVERMDGTSHPKIVDLSLYGSRGSMESSQGSWKILFCPWQRMGHFRNLFQLGCLGVKAWCTLGRQAWPSFLISGAICSVGSIGPSKQIRWA